MKPRHQIDNLLTITPFIDDDARIVAEPFQVIICDSVSGVEMVDPV